MPTMSRRRVLGAAASVFGSALAAHGSETARPPLKLGLIGCGSRGIWIGGLFQQHSNSKVVAVHDYFRDRTEEAARRLDVDTTRCHTGLNGYQALLESDVDAVAIISPPYFHPEQVVHALELGKHVYLAKPIAVDVSGCNAILGAANAVEGRLSCLVDFQTRKTPAYQEAVKRVREGMIGEPVCGQTYYHTGRLNVKTAPGTETARLRNWVFDKALSGDIIVEQNVHVIDVTNWLLGSHPLSATGCGGRRGRTDVGDCWDHFIVTYRYPNDVLIDFSSSQFAPGYNDLCARVYGTQGTVDTHYGGDVTIRAKQDTWIGEPAPQIYAEGPIANIRDFCAGIAAGSPVSNIRESAESTLAAILGRMAAYSGASISWDDMMSSGEKLDAKLQLPEAGPDATG